MAKELPYLKFEPSEWLEGQIQICSDEAVVCFINLMSGYWLKLGCINYAFALHKYCRKDKAIIKELLDNGIIELDDDNIVIKFLDDQLDEFQKTSEKRRKAANKRWADANALQKDSKSSAIREDKSREKKKKEDESKNGDFWDSIKKPSLSKASELVLLYGYDERFTFLYDLSFKKDAKLPAFRYWLGLSLEEKRLAHTHWVEYVKIKNDRFQKLFRTYLGDRGWESDLESLKNSNNGGLQQQISSDAEFIAGGK